MSFNQPANSSTGDPPIAGSNMGNNLEAQLRGMILTNHQIGNPHEPVPVQHPGSLRFSNQIQPQQGHAIPFFGMSGNMAGPVTSFNQSPHATAQISGFPPMFPMSSNFPPVPQGLPPPGLFFPGGEFADLPASPVGFQAYPRPPPGLQTADLPSPTSLQYSPSQRSGPQSQHPNTPRHHDYVPPHMRYGYGQQPTSSQQNSSQKQRAKPPQMSTGRTRGRDVNSSPTYSRVPPPTALDHFPPLGTQPVKSKSPPSNIHQQPTAQKPQQRIQYQPLPINTHNNPPPRGSGPTRGNFRNNNHAGRPPQHYIEQIAAEQSHHLNELSKQIITEAAPLELETSIKHALLKKLEAICKKISPDAKLVPFGSLVTGFATANSDLDVIFTGGSQAIFPDKPPSEDPDELEDNPISPEFRLPLLLESKLQDEGFDAQLLTKTRVPILKLVQNATEETPFELHCDIGFSNHLAVFNTQMLLTYSKCDPRVKQMMIFIKWWAKKRHINNPYRGTLSSYGYALIVLHYLINIVKPPVLQNLQSFPIPENTPTEEIIFEGDDNESLFEIWFYKAIDKLQQSNNKMHLGELLRGFFEYYAYTFQWGREVVSIRTRGGLLTKQEKGWVAAVIRPGKNSEVKDRYLFAVEDPFEIEHNVSRTCNGPGVGRIKEEFKRAVRLIRYRDGGKTVSECLCMEAPPERPWIRREDRDRVGQGGEGGDGGGEVQNHGANGDGERHEVEVDRNFMTRENFGVGGESLIQDLKYEGPIMGIGDTSAKVPNAS